MQVRVPGKVMLCGEYTVLLGGMAVLVPVPRYLTLTLIDEPGLDEENPVIREALDEPIAELEEWESSHPQLHVSVDRSQFTITSQDGRTQKLGLGGSAAEAVAVITMRFKRCGMDWKKIPETIFKYADAAHRAAQGGMGSGADVAAIAYRMPIRFQRTGRVSRVEIIEKPVPEHILNLNLLWTGVSANTRELVPPFLEWTRADNAKPVLEELIELSNQMAQRLFSTTSSEFDEIYQLYFNLLSSTLKSAGINWQLPIHEELSQWTSDHQGWAKPTGAGGGDMALLIGDLPLEKRSELIIPLDPFGDV